MFCLDFQMHIMESSELSNLFSVQIAQYCVIGWTL